MNTQDTRPRRFSTPAFILIIIALGALGLIIYLSHNSNLQDAATPSLNQRFPEQENNKTGVQAPLLPPEEDKVFSYTGQISAINQDRGTITISTERGEKIVTVTSQTQIVTRRSLTREERNSLTPEQIADTVASEQIYLGALQLNDTVTAISTENIRGKTEFPVIKIIVLTK